MWFELRQTAWRVVTPPMYDIASRNNDQEQLWQRDVGNAFPTLAMAWLMTGDKKYRAAVEEWALASCSYPNWGYPGPNQAPISRLATNCSD